MQAIILAAGMGRRLKELTQNNTKCMIKVNGVTLIERMLLQLDSRNLSKIVIVVGYEGQKLIDYVSTLHISTPITYINNSVYEKTNNIYSLSLAKDYLCAEDTLLLESDIIFDDEILDRLIEDERENLALVDKYESWMDGTCVKLNDQDEIESFVHGKSFKFKEIKEYYKTVNIYKFSKWFSQSSYVPFLEAYQKALGLNEYYEQVLRVITMLDRSEIKAKRLNGEKWYEIDDIQDLDIASSIFMPDEDRQIDMVSSRFGGYWRYPSLLDFYYLVNPYYPPQRMIDEIKASFEMFLTQYPSGMRVNSLLAANNFSVHRENIIVGNGAAELIKALLEEFDGKLGIVRPTFEEYSHRYAEEKIVVFDSERIGFHYSADELISYFENKPIDNLVIVNPDNPSGNYIAKKELLRLIQWAGNHSINIVIDESFVDFSDEKDASVIDQTILDANPHLYVIKSISKSYGVPGLRLGVLASGDTEMIARLKKNVSIWNINSFAEFYLQIAEKYQKDYLAAIEKFKVERARFTGELEKIKGISILSSQANFIMVELINGVSSRELAIKMLRHNILIKDLSKKIKDHSRQFIRLAIRSFEDNNRLIEVMKELCCTV